MGVFVIAEAGSSHDNDLAKAFRLIEAAKECGADAVKFQWTSNANKMADRRGLGDDAALMYTKYLQKSKDWLHQLKAHADKVGVEFMCTAYLIEDIATIAPLVKRFKVSAFEAEWLEFLHAHVPFNKRMIVSHNPQYKIPEDYFGDFWRDVCDGPGQPEYLHCISKYPTPIEELGLTACTRDEGDGMGLSDHTTSTLTGALAVAAGATIVEKHIKLSDTDPGNPDYGHSLVADTNNPEFSFKRYVDNIRIAERCL